MRSGLTRTGRLHRLLAIGLSLMMLGAACGSDGDSGSASETTAAPATTAAPRGAGDDRGAG